MRPAGVAVSATSPVDLPGLHNIVAYSPGLYSGAAPEGDRAFETLKSLGVHTVISVDGAAPDVEAARRAGMKYIHLPIGYNGMDRHRTVEIARAVQLAREEAGGADAPVYVHCHHGKHRSAGATGAAAVTLGYITPEEGLARMKVSGTALNYTGLFHCVEVASPASSAELAAAGSEFPEVWRATGLVQTMVEVDEVYDHLKAIERAGWSVPKDHPDLVPAAEAGRLADLFRNVHEESQDKYKSAEFAAWMSHSSGLAGDIERSLASGASVDAGALSAKFKMLGASCKECHAKYRD